MFSTKMHGLSSILGIFCLLNKFETKLIPLTVSEEGREATHAEAQELCQDSYKVTKRTK